MARTRTHVALIATVAAAGAALLVGCGGEHAESARATAAPSATRAVADPSATPVIAAAAPTITAMPEPSVTAPAAPVTSIAAPSTEAPQPTATPRAPVAGVTVTIAAQNARFVPVAASAPLGARVTLVFNNDDAGVAHDLVLYDPGRARVGATSIFNGPGMELFSFDATVAGRYPYACTVHRGMGGALMVE